MSPSRRPAGALLLALTVLSLSACGGVSPSPSPPQTARVQGTAMLAGGPAPGSARPLPGITVAVHEDDRHGKIVATAKTDTSGAFEVDLPPGTYTLILVSDGAVPETVTLEPGDDTTVTLYIQAP